MAYLGRQPIVGNYQVLDALTATATDTYALTKGGVAVFPQTPANCIVSLNGVIQAPFSSYNISGSNIVFDSALTGSDSIDFITVLGDVLNVGTVSDGTIGLAKLSATGTKDATTFLRGDNTFAVPAGGTNTPVFYAYRNITSQSISTNTDTVVQFNAEYIDSNNAYDTSTYRFTPSAGTYLLGFNLTIVPSSTSLRQVRIKIVKSGATTWGAQGIFSPVNIYENSAPTWISSSALVQANGTDYFSVYIYGYNSAFTVESTVNYPCHFYGYKIIE